MSTIQVDVHQRDTHLGDVVLSGLLLFPRLRTGRRGENSSSNLCDCLLLWRFCRRRVGEQARASVGDELELRCLIQKVSTYILLIIDGDPLTCSVSSRPMIAVGSNARHAQCARGYQYQNWQNSTIPTMAFVFRLPARLCRLIVTLRPPASIKPCPRAAPNRAMGSSCLSAMIFAYNARVEDRDGVDASDCSTRIIPRAMRAP